MKHIKTIGVLGGMGPRASAKFYDLLITCAQKDFGAVQDAEYPHIVLNSLSLRGSSESGMTKSPLIVNQLTAGAQALEAAGAEFLVIPCNSVHHSLAEIQDAVSIPVLSIVEATAHQVNQAGVQKALLLSSETTHDSALYEPHLNGVMLVYPAARIRHALNKIIASVMGGTDAERAKSLVVQLLQDCAKTKKVDAAILGCTELPLVIQQADTDLPLFNSLDALAKTAIQYAYSSQYAHNNGGGVHGQPNQALHATA